MSSDHVLRPCPPTMSSDHLLRSCPPTSCKYPVLTPSPIPFLARRYCNLRRHFPPLSGRGHGHENGCSLSLHVYVTHFGVSRSCSCRAPCTICSLHIRGRPANTHQAQRRVLHAAGLLRPRGPTRCLRMRNTRDVPRWIRFRFCGKGFAQSLSRGRQR